MRGGRKARSLKETLIPDKSLMKSRKGARGARRRKPSVREAAPLGRKATSAEERFLMENPSLVPKGTDLKELARYLRVPIRPGISGRRRRTATKENPYKGRDHWSAAEKAWKKELKRQGEGKLEAWEKRRKAAQRAEEQKIRNTLRGQLGG